MFKFLCDGQGPVRKQSSTHTGHAAFLLSLGQHLKNLLSLEVYPVHTILEGLCHPGK